MIMLDKRDPPMCTKVVDSAIERLVNPPKPRKKTEKQLFAKVPPSCPGAKSKSK
jgi:hypothetical protein